jgi:hypothetical protein
MPRLKLISDPTDKASKILVDLDDIITIGEVQEYCDLCHVWMKYTEDGRYTFWAGEKDKWFCEIHE